LIDFISDWNNFPYDNTVKQLAYCKKLYWKIFRLSFEIWSGKTGF